MTSLEALTEERGFDPVDSTPAAGESLDGKRMAAKLRAAIDKLPDREKSLLTKHYFEGKNLLEAGAELGISKSWASRMHAQAVDRLRKVVDDG